jgi:hypothetical protein
MIALREAQKNHESLRENNLSTVAKARVIANGQLYSEARFEKEIIQIKARERKRKMFRKIRWNLYKPPTMTGLAKVDVPASENEEPYPIGPDPKIWKGSWH